MTLIIINTHIVHTKLTQSIYKGKLKIGNQNVSQIICIGIQDNHYKHILRQAE